MEVPRRTSGRVRNPVQRFMHESYFLSHNAYMNNVVQSEPDIVDEALASPKWLQAMLDEYGALESHGTWDLVPLPPTKKAIGCKWIFKIERNSDGSIARHKARLVAKGYAQQHGIDYEKVFSPVAKMTTVRTIAAIAAANHWEIRQIDFCNAFLNGDMTEEVYMLQPPGFENPEAPTHVCRLKKAIYGLKQAPRAWYAKISSYLLSLGFKSCSSDSSLYTYHSGSDCILIAIYVDDLQITGNSPSLMDSISSKLSATFAMKDLGELKYFLGIEFIRSKDSLWILQQKYAKDMLLKFQFLDCLPISTCLEQNCHLHASEGELRRIGMRWIKCWARWSGKCGGQIRSAMSNVANAQLPSFFVHSARGGIQKG